VLDVALHAEIAALFGDNGIEDPGEGTPDEGRDRLGVFHADRDASGLLDAERGAKLVPGVLGFDVLGLIGGKLSENGGDEVIRLSIAIDAAEVADAMLMLSGPMLKPATVRSERKSGET
jgi:hypothetical protein